VKLFTAESGFFDEKALLVTLGCLLSSFAGSYFLYLDLNASSVGGNGPALATLEYRENKVRKKASNSYIWTNIDTQQEIYLKDSIQTGPGAIASIKLKNGSVIELGENSLIVVNADNEMALDFQQGSGVVRGQSGAAQKIAKDKDGKTTVETLQVSLVKPEPLAEIFISSGDTRMTIEFAWKIDSGSEHPPKTLEVSTDQAFPAGKTQKFALNAKQDSQSATFTPNRYFWRIMSSDGQAVSEVGRFRVSMAPVIQPISVAKDSTVLTLGKDQPVQIRWKIPTNKEDADLGKHQLEISDSDEFTKVIKSQKIVPSTGVATFSGLDHGEYYWRIKSAYGGKNVVSAPERMNLEAPRNVSIDMIAPKEGDKIKRAKSLAFQWKSSVNNITFDWELQNDQGVTIKKWSGMGNAFIWQNPDAGSYRWRVSARWENKVLSEGTWNDFSLSDPDQSKLLEAPSRTTPDTGTVFNPVEEKRFPSLSWDVVAGAQSYEITINTVDQRGLASEKPVLKTVVQKNSLELKTLAEGKYRWTVRAIDSQKQAGAAAPLKEFSISYGETLDAPEVTTEHE
jgi:hypothetical protein